MQLPHCLTLFVTHTVIARLKELEAENKRLKKMYAKERLKAESVVEATEESW